MNSKVIHIVLLISLIICFALGGVGLYRDKFYKKTEPPKPTIKYEYYLDNNKVSVEKITNSVDEISSMTSEGEYTTEEIRNVDYLFQEYSCTNGVVGEFNTETWEFEPSVVKDSVCKLFFNKAKYGITLTITNGNVPEGTDMFVNREANGSFNVIPNEGYEFDTYACSNDKEGVWDSTNNTFNINAIVEDVACKISFKLRQVKMDLSVVNGTGSTSETVTYGDKISVVVAANQGFENPTISCTNNQKASIKNNTVELEKITDDTVCTVKYNPVKVEEYALTIENLPYTVKITSGTTSQNIKKGEIGQFTLKPDATFTIKSVSCYKTGSPETIITPVMKDNADGFRTYSFRDMSHPITCKVEAQ